MPTRRNFATVAALSGLLFAFAGCASTGSGWNLFGAWFGRKAAAEAKNEAKAGETENRLVTAAQVEVQKTAVALDAAVAAHPGSRPVLVAQRTNRNALGLLNQRNPLGLDLVEEAERITQGLLSVEVAAREAAEAKQAASEKQNIGIAAELGAIREKAKQLAKERTAEAAKNLELANELRVSKILQYASTAASVGLGLLALAYRLNIGRFQEGLGTVLAHVQTKHGDDAGKVARLVAGEVLHTGEQKGVFKFFSETLAKKA